MADKKTTKQHEQNDTMSERERDLEVQRENAEKVKGGLNSQA